jgi:hypothetical protein
MERMVSEIQKGGQDWAKSKQHFHLFFTDHFFLAELILFSAEDEGWRLLQLQSTQQHIQKDSKQCLMKITIFRNVMTCSLVEVY